MPCESVQDNGTATPPPRPVFQVRLASENTTTSSCIPVMPYVMGPGQRTVNSTQEAPHQNVLPTCAVLGSPLGQ